MSLGFFSCIKYLVIIGLCIIFLFTQPARGQVSYQPLPHTPDCNYFPWMKLQASGITTDGSCFYVALEGCGAVLKIDLTGSTPNQELLWNTSSIDKGSKNPEIEGIAYYNQKLFLVDEANTIVYKMDTSSPSNTQKINIDPSFGIKRSGQYGLEGIAFDPSSRLFYLLHESTRNRKDICSDAKYIAKIYVTKLSEDQKTLEPAFGNAEQSTFPICIVKKSRYTDIHYDQINSKLLALYTRKNPAFYKVMEIGLDSSGKPTGENTEIMELTAKVEYARDNLHFSSNLEGVTVDSSGTLYIVSDNYSGSKPYNEKADDVTLLLKVEQ